MPNNKGSKWAPKPTHDLADTDVAWAAGFLEGEGAFVRWSSGRNNYARVKVGQTETEPLERLRLMFGGTICIQREAMQPSAGSYGRKRLYQWQVIGTAAERLIRYVLPYLCERRTAQALKALTPLPKQLEGE